MHTAILSESARTGPNLSQCQFSGSGDLIDFVAVLTADMEDVNFLDPVPFNATILLHCWDFLL